MEAEPGVRFPTADVEFAAEWEARLFAMVSTLVANDVFDWADFRAHLVRLNRARSNDLDDAKGTSLALWAHALRNLLHERGLFP